MNSAWFYLLLLPPLAPLVREDFRSQQVAVVWLAALAVATWTAGWVTQGLSATLVYAGLNLALLLLTGGGLALYLRLRRHSGRLFDRWIGAGDAVFLVAVSPIFTPEHFLGFLIVSCTAALAGCILLRWRTIPLVGVMGLVLCVTVICKSVELWN